MLAVIIHQVRYPMFQKTISLPSHCIFADLNINTKGSDRVLSLHEIEVLKPVSVWFGFVKKKRRWWKEGLILWPAGAQPLATRASFRNTQGPHSATHKVMMTNQAI